jgi:hypothetical protein
VVTLGALEFGALLSGAVLTEQVFTIPGFGKLIVDAVFNRDYAVVQGVVLCTAFAYILLNLFADIAYALVNPRLAGMTAETLDPGGDAGNPRSRNRRAPWQRAVRQLAQRRMAVAGLAVVLFFIALAILAPLISPYNPLATSWSAVRKPPSTAASLRHRRDRPRRLWRG